MGKQIIVNVVFAADGSVNIQATDRQYAELRDKLALTVTQTWDTLGVELSSYLLERPGLKTIATAALVRGVQTARLENGFYKGQSHEAKEAGFSQLEEMVPEYVKANTDRFHTGRKLGIAIRYVPGEAQRDTEGNELFDKTTGDPVQAFRYSDEEWAKMTAVKEPSTANGAAATASA